MVETRSTSLVPERLKSKVAFPVPSSLDQIWHSLGILNFCRGFLPEIFKVLLLLLVILVGKQCIMLTHETSQAFAISKQILVDAVQLANLQPDAPLLLVSDASNDAIGTAFHHALVDTTQPLGFFTMKLYTSLASYSTFSREHIVDGKQFKNSSDHNTLTSIPKPSLTN